MDKQRRQIPFELNLIGFKYNMLGIRRDVLRPHCVRTVQIINRQYIIELRRWCANAEENHFVMSAGLFRLDDGEHAFAEHACFCLHASCVVRALSAVVAMVRVCGLGWNSLGSTMGWSVCARRLMYWQNRCRHRLSHCVSHDSVLREPYHLFVIWILRTFRYRRPIFLWTGSHV